MPHRVVAPRRQGPHQRGRAASPPPSNPTRAKARGVRGVLHGVRVLDFSHVLSGPFATAQLAALGAEIVKVERPGKGDDTRAFGPPFVDDTAAYFLSVNRGKRSICLDLKRPAGQRLAARLAQRADVVVENFRPGTAPRLGIDLARWRAHRPELIACRISGFGPGGPDAYSKAPGYDLIIQAISGLMAITGPKAGPPTKVGIAIADLVTGLYASQGILAALLQRAQTGLGATLELSMQEAMLSLLTYQASAVWATGRPPERWGNGHPSIYPYDSFETQDAPIVVAVGTDPQFRRLCRALGHAEWGQDPRFARNRDRVEHRAELEPLLGAAFRTKGHADWAAILRAEDIPAGPILGLDAALAHPQLAARGAVEAAASATDLPHVASPLRALGPKTALAPAPRLGADRDAVLAEWLAMRPTSIERWRRTGAFGACKPGTRVPGNVDDNG